MTLEWEVFKVIFVNVHIMLTLFVVQIENKELYSVIERK